ncbi:hypothetical protein JCM8547_005212 [Rhodosporidiobolus lusitaniae]
MPPRGLSKEARAALVEGYQNPHLLPAGRTLRQRLSDFMFARLGERYSEQQIMNALSTLSKEGVVRLQPRGVSLLICHFSSPSFPSELTAVASTTPLKQNYVKALTDYVKPKFPSETITVLQVRTMIDYLRQHHQVSDLPPSHASESASSPYQPVAATEEEERPVVLHHHGIMFSGPDHVVVPNNEVHYDAQRQEYIDSHGQTVIPHWINDEFF